MMLICNVSADNVQEKICTMPKTSIPFAGTKATLFPKTIYMLTGDIPESLPVYVYDDLALQQKNYDSNIECSLCQRFDYSNKNFELLAITIGVYDWTKKILATYQGNTLVDFIEIEIGWWNRNLMCVKQWRMDSNENIIITWIKVASSTPISAFSDFGNVEGQRIDMYYTIDSLGHFHLDKEIKYKPQIYTRSYLEDSSKELWDGDEVLLN